MRDISESEISLVEGGSLEGAGAVLTAALIGAAAGSLVPGVGNLVGAVAGAISAGGHTLIIWNVLK